MKRIVVDMMGGDLAPLETVKGVCMAAKELEAEFILVGNEPELLRVAKENGLSLDGFKIVHTDTVITMEDDPLSVMRTKSDSSMSIGLHLLANDEGDAFVSTGNTGALFTGASLIVRKIKGARRPAIAAVLPMQPPVLLVDSGANITVSADDCDRFAVMGSVYMKKMMDVDTPRVGLLNNGAEEHKGTDIVREARGRLAENSLINFVGNVEGNRVMENACDVLVCDGFAGNIHLKTMEGMGKLMLSTLRTLFGVNLRTKLAYLLVKPYLGTVKKNFDATEFGGAPILGISKPVIKAHGSSNAKAFKNAIKQAIACAENDLAADISDALAALSAQRTAENAEGDTNTNN